MNEKHHRSIRSFVLRQGRLTKAQQLALETAWPEFGIEYSNQVVNFEQVFGNKNPVTLEIGFGNGASLFEQAMYKPGENFLGIEVHRPGVGHLLGLIAQNGLQNIRVLNHDAIEVINHMIPDGSLSCVQLFFPDPWHKKRHHKRRIVQPAFADLVREKLTTNGLFHMATDWEEYAVHMMNTLEAARGFSNTAGNYSYATNTGRPGTKFEARGQHLGHEVFDLVFCKNTP